MTNDEAIEKIQTLRFFLRIRDPKATDILEALEMAMRSLTRDKTGRWIKHEYDDDLYHYGCSQCGCVAPCVETADKLIWKLSNYCPDCRAKMENGGNIWQK